MTEQQNDEATNLEVFVAGEGTRVSKQRQRRRQQQRRAQRLVGREVRGQHGAEFEQAVRDAGRDVAEYEAQAAGEDERQTQTETGIWADVNGRTNEQMSERANG